MKRICFTIIAVAVLLTAPAFAADKELAAASKSRSQIAAAIIRDLYARLAKYSRGTEDELRFELDNFRTLYGERARQARLLDLFSPPEGRLVDVHIEHSAQGEDLRAAYRARWSSEEAPRLEDTADYAHRDATLEELIRETSLESPELAEISAVTTYRVTVHLAGKSRTYRAAVFWIQLPAGLTRSQVAEAQYVIQDQITVGLSDVAQETALALSDPPRQPVRAVPDLADLRKNAPVCAQTFHSQSLETVYTPSNQEYQPNFSGWITCTCDSSCISGCSPSGITASCGHTSCRRTTTDLVTTTAYTYAFGAAKGAECAAGWACAGIKCSKILWWCSCGSVTVKVSISYKLGNVTPSLGVDYTIAPSNAYSRKVNGVMVCPPCFAASSPDPGGTDFYPDGGGNNVSDVVCGDGICDEGLGESLSNCPLDCDVAPVCGNGSCESGESSYSCPDDCARCGDFICSAGEDHFSCPGDCCVPGECQ